MRVCHVIASVNRNVGGPAITVPRLASALATRGVQVDLATLDYPDHGPQTAAVGVAVSSTPTRWTNRLLRGWSHAFRRNLISVAQSGVDVIHNHGLWMFPNLYARQAAKASRITLVISPRGMVEPWSLRNSRIKKKVIWRLFERENLVSANLFHATSMAEAESIRALGLRQPIAVIPNGIEVPDSGQLADRNLLDSHFPELRDRRWLLFLSRLHPKKGIMELLHVWRQLRGRFPDWQLVLAGSDLDGYGTAIRRAVNDFGLCECVTLTGMLHGPEKESAFAGSELFVLPSHSENFGLVVAEALAHAIPVVTTRGTPWSGLVENGCGWWNEFSEPHLASALAEALDLSSAARRAMGERGREWMRREFSWDIVAQRMEAVYGYLLGNGDQPECVLSE